MRNSRTDALSGSKIKSFAGIKKISRALKKRGKSIVFTNGCFDILHYGHVKYLEEAKRKGDILIVGINSDSSIRSIKGKNRPIICQEDRSRTVAALASVDYVTLYNEDTPEKIIKAVKPDLLIKGSDWNKEDIVGAKFVASYGGKTKTIKHYKGRSTTNIINKIAKTY